MKFAIIGAGPIGSILGAYLSKSNHEVAFVDILKDHLEAIRKNGLIVSGTAEIKTSIAQTYDNVSGLKSFNPEVIFVCLKNPVTKMILPDLQNVYRDQTIVSFQNGLDAECDLADAFGKDSVLRVVINYAGNLIANGEVKMSFFNKPNYIGALSKAGAKNAEEIAKVMTASGLDTKAVPDIQKYVWEKVILNSALSPLCAITGQTMKQAMDFSGTYHIVEEVLKEGISVAKSLGYDYGADFYEHCIGYLKKAGHHKTSMHIDIENKRTTEINFINGKIVDYGKQSKISTPYNDTIVNIIKGIEARNKEDRKTLTAD